LNYETVAQLNGGSQRYTACLDVEIADQGVTIGEDENTVRLTHAEWNELSGLLRAASFAV
jgi:hypothetical protein